ncbi:sensor histidine kinase [Streptomyces sp. ODS28]|uniref:sensor histidine kinase n=1 Tax=Streptomyces sp. ODS28 TaxID=3136688 RepID=UPI0031E85688
MRPWLPHAPGFVLTAILLPVTVTMLMNDYGVAGGVAGALAVGQAGPLLLVAARPLTAWGVIFASDVVGAFVISPSLRHGLGDGPQQHPYPWTPMVVIGYLLVCVWLAARHGRRTLITVWLTGTAFSLLLASMKVSANGTSSLFIVLSGLVLLLGAVVRERSEARRQLAEQETISEAERARRTLLEERARIARELHDVVAHHMSVITVQADSAPYRLQGLPPEAAEEFGTIAGTARQSLSEMRRLLGVLRSEEAQGERTPQPGLDRLDQLVEATVRAGVPTDLELAPGLSLLPQGVQLSAYRIVQEALANVVRHAPGAATSVTVREADSGLSVRVVNGPARAARDGPLETSGTGHGLVGMRERVRLVGGSLETGATPEGGFRVAAELPLTSQESRESQEPQEQSPQQDAQSAQDAQTTHDIPQTATTRQEGEAAS